MNDQTVTLRPMSTMHPSIPLKTLQALITNEVTQSDSGTSHLSANGRRLPASRLNFRCTESTIRVRMSSVGLSELALLINGSGLVACDLKL